MYLSEGEKALKLNAQSICVAAAANLIKQTIYTAVAIARICTTMAAAAREKERGEIEQGQLE
jgi:hypothetical protein